MKTKIFSKPALAAVAGLALLAGNVLAQDSTTTTAQPAVSSQSVPQLSYTVTPILQMVQAKVSDSTVLAYIQNSSLSYRLSANQIIYLKQQGVSDAVLDAMLNHEPAAATDTTTVATTQPDNTSTAVAQPTVTYVQTVPSSTVYVDQPTPVYVTPDPYYYPAYYGYGYPYVYPAVSLSFGFGGHWGGGGYHGGGGHGGWHH